MKKHVLKVLLAISCWLSIAPANILGGEENVQYYRDDKYYTVWYRTVKEHDEAENNLAHKSSVTVHENTSVNNIQQSSPSLSEKKIKIYVYTTLEAANPVNREEADDDKPIKELSNEFDTTNLCVDETWKLLRCPRVITPEGYKKVKEMPFKNEDNRSTPEKELTQLSDAQVKTLADKLQGLDDLFTKPSSNRLSPPKLDPSDNKPEDVPTSDDIASPKQGNTTIIILSVGAVILIIGGFSYYIASQRSDTSAHKQ